MQSDERPPHDAPPEWFASPAAAEEVDMLRHWVAGLSAELQRARQERDEARRALEALQAELAAARQAGVEPAAAPAAVSPAATAESALERAASSTGALAGEADAPPAAAPWRPSGAVPRASAAAAPRGPLAAAAALLRRLGLPALVILAVAALALVGVGPWLLPYQVYVMRGESMAPALPRGSLVLAWPVGASQVWPGDVIVFRSPLDGRTTITHRVLSVTLQGDGAAIQTRGDANPAPDPWTVRASDLRGRVVAAAQLVGYPVLALQSIGGVLAVPLLGLFAASAVVTGSGLVRRGPAGAARRRPTADDNQ